MEKKHYVLNDLKTFKSLPYLKINLIILVLGLHLKHERYKIQDTRLAMETLPLESMKVVTANTQGTSKL